MRIPILGIMIFSLIATMLYFTNYFIAYTILTYSLVITSTILICTNISLIESIVHQIRNNALYIDTYLMMIFFLYQWGAIYHGIEYNWLLTNDFILPVTLLVISLVNRLMTLETLGE